MSMPRMLTDEFMIWKAAVEAAGGDTIGRVVAGSVPILTGRRYSALP